MIIHRLKTILAHNLILKLCSVGIAYGIWLIISQTQMVTFSTQVPVCLYNQSETLHVKTPTDVTIVLKGSRAQLALVDRQQLAVHIDCTTLAHGDNIIALDAAQHLYIPSSIDVVYYRPSPLTINVSPKQDVV